MIDKKMLLMAAIGVAFAPGVWATPSGATSSLTVDATVSTECVVSSTAIHFGEYAPITGGERMSDGIFTVYCTKGTAVQVGMGEGVNYNGVRRMTNGQDDFLTYGLYREPWGGIEWNDMLDGRVFIPYTSGIFGDPLIVWGRLQGFQNAPAGLYTDTVAINVWIQ